MFENDEDMESEIVTCIKNLPSRENCSFKCEFCPNIWLSEAGLSRHEKVKHQQHSWKKREQKLHLEPSQAVWLCSKYTSIQSGVATQVEDGYSKWI